MVTFYSPENILRYILASITLQWESRDLNHLPQSFPTLPIPEVAGLGGLCSCSAWICAVFAPVWLRWGWLSGGNSEPQ